MCIQCAAGAMTAVAGASGMRLWIEARFPGLMGPRTKKIVRRSLVGIGLLVAGLLGSSGASPGPATAAVGTGSTPAPRVAVAPSQATGLRVRALAAAGADVTRGATPRDGGTPAAAR